MLKRIILVKWDPSLGPSPLLQFPPEKKFINQEALLKIWAIHELNEEKSVIELEVEDTKILSYFVDYHRSSYFLILLMDLKDDSWGFSEVLSGIASNLVVSLDDPNFTRLLSETFQILKNTTSLNEEQIFYSLFKDKTRRTIMNILREGAISRKSLENRLHEEYGFTTINLEILLSPFYQLGLVKKEVIFDSDVYLLRQDVACLRLPPRKLMREISQKLRLNQNGEEREFLELLHQTYANHNPIADEISEKIFQDLDIFFNNEAYEVIKLLRKAPLKEAVFIEMLKTNRDLVRDLFDAKLIVKVRQSIYLLSDILFLKFLPEYIINPLITRYLNKKLPLDHFLSHVELLKLSRE